MLSDDLKTIETAGLPPPMQETESRIRDDTTSFNRTRAAHHASMLLMGREMPRSDESIEIRRG